MSKSPKNYSWYDPDKVLYKENDTANSTPYRFKGRQVPYNGNMNVPYGALTTDDGVVTDFDKNPDGPSGFSRGGSVSKCAGNVTLAQLRARHGKGV